MKTIDQLWQKLKDIEVVQVRPEEMELLYKKCFLRSNPVIVEIGSAHGASSTIFADAADELDGALFCIDNFVEGYEGQPKFGDYARKQFNKNLLNKNIQPVTLYDMDSRQAYQSLVSDLYPLEKEFIDVLFIDGDHSYEGVKSDCRLYLPLLEHGGFVGFHDYNNIAYAGVKKAADEFCAGWPVESVWDLRVFQKI